VSRRIEAVLGLAQLGTFIALWSVFFLTLQLGVIAAWLTVAGEPMSLAGLQSIVGGVPPTNVLLVTLLVQFAGMFVLAAGIVGVGGIVRRLQTGLRSLPWRKGFGLRGALPLAWVAAIAGGITVGWFPGFIAEQIRTLLPALDFGATGIVGDVLDSGTLTEKIALALIIAGLAPVVEELVFRGALWNALERWLPGPVVIGVTSLLFAGFHLDPAQAIPLLFTGAFLGWVRWTTGSVGPAIAVHMVNNALALTLSLLGLEQATGFLLASSLIITGAMGFVLWQTRVDLSEAVAT